MYKTHHGTGLSIVYSAWIKLHENQIHDRISNLAKMVFSTPDVGEFLVKLTSFFKQIESPVKLGEIGITKDKNLKLLIL